MGKAIKYFSKDQTIRSKRQKALGSVLKSKESGLIVIETKDNTEDEEL